MAIYAALLVIAFMHNRLSMPCSDLCLQCKKNFKSCELYTSWTQQSLC